MQRYLVATILAVAGLLGVTVLPGKLNKKAPAEPPRASQAVSATAPSDCTSSSTRPCYERQTGKKAVGVNSQGGEKAFDACLRNSSSRQFGEILIPQTALCKEELAQFCSEGESDVVLRKFDGTCKAPTCPSWPFVKFVSGVEPGWDDPATNTGLRTIFKSKNGTLYVGGFKGITLSTPLLGKIYRSSDNGQSWTAAALPTNNDQYGSFVRRIVEDARGTLYASGYRLWKSTDAGATWFIISQSIADLSLGVGVDDVLVSKDGSLLALVRSTRPYGSDYNEVHQSRNDGITWQKILGPVFQSYASYNFMEADDGSLVFATHNGDIHLYANGTLTKTLVTDIYGGNITFLKAKDGTLYFVGGDPATPSEALVGYRSSDNGKTWAKSEELPFSRLVAIDAPIEAADGSLWVAAWTFCGDVTVYRSQDSGITWTPAATSPTSQYAHIIDNNSLQGPFIHDIAESEGRILTVPYEFPAVFEVPR